MKSAIFLVVLVSVLVVTDALVLSPHSKRHGGQQSQMLSGKSSCYGKVPLSLAQQSAMSKIPGAGMDHQALKPFAQVYKDGFMMSACVKDQMFYKGDAFGDNKFSYALGKTLNVSVVHYSQIVPREDQESMTPNVCFNFCRTMKDMHFFGITNGRDCYCEPFYHMEAGDSSDCDAVCDGDASQTCGGKTKSNVYEMHACSDGPVVLGVQMVYVYNYKELIDELAPLATAAAQGKQELSSELQAQFGSVGDPAAAGLMQKGKESAGELLHAAERAAAVVETIRGTLQVAFELTGLTMDSLEKVTTSRLGDEDLGIAEVVSDALGELPAGATPDFANFAIVKKADDAVALMKEQVKSAKKAFTELQQLYAANEPEVNDIFFVKSGSCVVSQDGCVMSKSLKNSEGESKPYMNSEDCVIELPPNGADIKLEYFETDPLYDYLTLNGQIYTSKIDTSKCPEPFCPLTNWQPMKGLENAVLDSCFAGADGENPAFAGLLSYTGGTCPDAAGEGVVLKDVKHASGVIKFHTDFVLQEGGFKICAENIKSKDNAIQYYPLMYFVDKTFEDKPTTCTGTVVGEPIYYKSVHSCAAACDAAVHDCVGFSYYPDTSLANNKGPNICFLFSKFDSATYYTGCDAGEQGEKSGFIQKDNSTANVGTPIVEDPVVPVCGLKLSKFVGTHITPDPSGKCPGCLKTLTKADRCFKA